MRERRRGRLGSLRMGILLVLAVPVVYAFGNGRGDKGKFPDLPEKIKQKRRRQALREGDYVLLYSGAAPKCGANFGNSSFNITASVFSLIDSSSGTKESKFSYLIGFCKNVESDDIDEPYIPTKCEEVLAENGGGVAALQYLPTENDDDSGSGTCYALGGHLDGSGANMSFEKLRPSDPSMGFTLKYANGEKCMHGANNPRRSISIDHVCADRAARDDRGYVIESISCQYTVIIENREGCPRECPIVTSQGIGANRVCNAKGVCRFSTSENKPKCFCDEGYKGSKCNETAHGNGHGQGHGHGSSHQSTHSSKPEYAVGGFLGGFFFSILTGVGIDYYLYTQNPRRVGRKLSVQLLEGQNSSGDDPSDSKWNNETRGVPGIRPVTHSVKPKHEPNQVERLEEFAKLGDESAIRNLRGSLNSVDAAGNTVLHKLLKNSDKDTQDIAAWLLLLDDLNFDVNIQDDRGKTILHLAVEKSNANVAEAIFRWGPNTALVDENNKTVLAYLNQLRDQDMFRRVYLEHHDHFDVSAGGDELISL